MGAVSTRATDFSHQQKGKESQTPSINLEVLPSNLVGEIRKAGTSSVPSTNRGQQMDTSVFRVGVTRDFLGPDGTCDLDDIAGPLF